MAAVSDATQERPDSPDVAGRLSTDRTSRSRSPGASADSAQPQPDASERPVREQLKKTTLTAPEIATEQSNTHDALSDAGSDAGRSDNNTEGTSARGRPRRKRSFEELDTDQHDGRAGTSGSKHLRKRSREDEKSDVAESEAPLSSAAPEGTEVNANEYSSGATLQQDSIHDENHSSARPVTPTTSSKDTATTAEAMAFSPQNKRNRDQFVQGQGANVEKPSLETKSSELAGPSSKLDKQSDPSSSGAGEEPYSKRLRDETASQATKSSSEDSKIPPSSGFSNASATSPFGSLAAPKSPPSQPQTSSTAFASSGFASFASSTSSPFGTFGSAKPSEETKENPPTALSASSSAPLSGFGALGGSAPSPFAAAAAPTFGSQSSGFAKLSNGLASGSSFGGQPLSSFASAGGSGIIGASSKTTSRPIGTSAEPDDEDEDGDAKDEDDENGEAGQRSADDDHKDSRFHEQDLETGEEGEVTVFNNRAKLYVSQEKQWKERGVGVFKVNVAQRSDEESSAKKSARFIMRADGSHRIVLNSPIKKQITIEDPTGGPPKGKSAIFLGFIDDKPTMMQLKMRSNDQTEELYNIVTTLQRAL